MGVFKTVWRYDKCQLKSKTGFGVNKERLELSESEREQWPSLERLAISAGLIQSALSSVYPAAGESLVCPYLRLSAQGDVEPMAIAEDGSSKSLFEVWPNKFGKLAFGFARDHLEMSAPKLFERLRAIAAQSPRGVLTLGPFEFQIKAGVGFAQGCEPARVSAPAHLALCKKMAQTPGWIMEALERMERGEPALAPHSVSGPRAKL